jgi:shikimate kinase
MNRRIVILGFMACGKTTVAKELARQLDAEFIDLDTFVTDREGRSPADIISTDGESVFRQIETAALNQALTGTEARVIALGGGTWTVPKNRTLIALHDCATVWLDVPFDLCWARIRSGGDTIRPLAPDYATAQHRYEQRREIYRLSEVHIPNGDLDPRELAEKIVQACA